MESFPIEILVHVLNKLCIQDCISMFHVNKYFHCLQKQSYQNMIRFICFNGFDKIKLYNFMFGSNIFIICHHNKQSNIRFDETTLNIIVDANHKYYLQFLAEIVRNVSILLGYMRMNCEIHNTLKESIGNIKQITRYAGCNYTLPIIKQIVTITDKIQQTHTDELKYINGDSKELTIIQPSNNMFVLNELLINLIGIISKRRMKIDAALCNQLNLDSITIYIDGLMYFPNATLLFSLSKKYPTIKFYVKLSHDNDLIIELFAQTQNITIVDNMLYCLQNISNEAYIYTIETVNTMPHTQLNEDIYKNKLKNIAFVFGSESNGISKEVFYFLNQRKQHKNVQIISYAPYFNYHNIYGMNDTDELKTEQNQSLNVMACVTVILSSIL